MAVWDHPQRFDDPSPAELEYAEIWQAIDKVVYSRTLTDVVTSRTRLERSFSPDDVRAMKASAPGDISIGGAELAGHAIRAGLVDEYRLFVNPIVVGGGKRALPDDAWWELELLDERRFANGVVYLRYATRPRR
jgi:dihydrofolate reductase